MSLHIQGFVNNGLGHQVPHVLLMLLARHVQTERILCDDLAIARDKSGASEVTAHTGVVEVANQVLVLEAAVCGQWPGNMR